MFGLIHITEYFLFKWFIKIMVCINIFCACQTMAISGPTDYYPLSITNGKEHGVTECRDTIDLEGVYKVDLQGTSSPTYGCNCHFEVDKEGFNTKDIRWTISRSQRKTLHLIQTWFRETDDENFMWHFNITSEGGATTVTFKKEQETFTTIELQDETDELKLQTYSANSEKMHLLCHSSDITGTTEMTTGPPSPDKATVAAPTESTKRQSTIDTTKQTVHDHPRSSTTPHLPSMSINDARNDHPTSASKETSSKDSKKMLYIIIAAVGGGVLLLVAIIVVIIICIRKRNPQDTENHKRPGSSPAVLYSNLSRSDGSRNQEGKASPTGYKTNDEQELPNQSEFVGTTYADIDPKSLVSKDKKTEATPGGEQGNDQGLTYADLDLAANGQQQSDRAHDPRDDLYAKPNKRH